jgi:hypothetical protein
MAVDTERKEYTAMAGKWQKCRDVVAGEDAVKARGEVYLPRPSGQDHNQYSAYVTRGTFYGGTERTLAALVGMVFRKDPVTQVAGRIEPFLQDVTLNDTPLETFAIRLLEEVLTVGRYGILVDVQDETSGRIPQERRPYIVPYAAEQIINWRVTMNGGDAVLSLVVLKERREVELPDFGYEEQTRYRVLQLLNGVYQVTVWQKKKNSNGQEGNQFEVVEGPSVPTRQEQPLSFIPFIMVGPTGLEADLVDPPLLALANMNLSLYRTETDLEHGAHLTALPTPVVIGAVYQMDAAGMPMKMTIGPGSTIELPVGGDAKMLEFSGAGLASLETRAKVKIERMAVLGAQLIAPNDSMHGQETVIGATSRQTASHAELKTITKTASQALTRVLRLISWWAGAATDVNDEKVNVALNLAFDQVKVTGEELRTLVLAVQGGTMSFRWFYHIMEKGEMTPPDVTFEEEWQQIKTEQPADVLPTDDDAPGGRDPLARPKPAKASLT